MLEQKTQFPNGAGFQIAHRARICISNVGISGPFARALSGEDNPGSSYDFHERTLE